MAIEERVSLGKVEGRFTMLKALPEHAVTDLLFAYAPGAASNLQDPFGRFLSSELAAAGIECWRFQFPYMEVGRSAPDRPSVLETAWRDVIGAAHASRRRVVAGGRSMGGRIASQVAAQGEDIAGLVLFAYPLHPPGRPDKARTAHLSSISVPTLFCSGTRDNFGSQEELRAAASLVPRSTVHVLLGADHGFSVLKSTGRTRQDAWADAASALFDFLQTIATSKLPRGRA